MSDAAGAFFDAKNGFFDLGRSRLLKEPDASPANGKTHKLGVHELTLSYLCDNQKVAGDGKDLLGAMEAGRSKGKEIADEDAPARSFERDFLQLSGEKRFLVDAGAGAGAGEKRARVEQLNLSLAPPDVALSLNSSNPPAPVAKKAASVQSSWCSDAAALSLTCSDDFTASRSYSYSHQLSHNPSCSLTRNSAGDHYYDADQIWHCGEGTNGSVHSRFRPVVGDGFNKSSNLCSENQSAFPSELPARPGNGKAIASSDSTRPSKLLREIVSESVPVMAQLLKEIPTETLESTKEYLRGLLGNSEKTEELGSLQRRLERRSDLTVETVSKCSKLQLQILVAIRTGIKSFLSDNQPCSSKELLEIFLHTRCKNISCKNLIPVDDCDCKICSTNKGFCGHCTCQVCIKFDFANNTCSWVGCDVCLHWCHVMCGIQMNLIKPGPSSKGGSGTTEMQFNCLGCGHASEMFGFVKEVFDQCAKDWCLDTLVKELDCVRKVFKGSMDVKGIELHKKAEEMLLKLENKLVSDKDACKEILQYFTSGNLGTSSSISASKDMLQTTTPIPKLEALPSARSAIPQNGSYILQSSNGRLDSIKESPRKIIKETQPIVKSLNREMLSFGNPKKAEFDSLETIIRIKEAEARMFQNKADEARAEAEKFRKLVRDGNEKLEEDYARKIAKLCLQEAEEKRRIKLEELKLLENSHCDYYKMKMRMEAEISNLLKRMEATKQQWV